MKLQDYENGFYIMLADEFTSEIVSWIADGSLMPGDLDKEFVMDNFCELADNTMNESVAIVERFYKLPQGVRGEFFEEVMKALGFKTPMSKAVDYAIKCRVSSIIDTMHHELKDDFFHEDVAMYLENAEQQDEAAELAHRRIVIALEALIR